MQVSFQDVETAFDFVSTGAYGANSALLNSSTGQIHCSSELGEFDELPEEFLESGSVIEIPHKNDLDLGNQLVFDFILSHSPDDYEAVREMFSRRGAYSRYKDLLELKGLLREWYDFEGKAREEALREWCRENGIELID